jgi:hypothetical protein
VLTGVAEKARSGRNDVTKEPIIEDTVGGESSEISWYALSKYRDVKMRAFSEYYTVMMALTSRRPLLQTQQPNTSCAVPQHP